MRPRRAASFAAFGLALLLAGAAHAQSLSDGEIRARARGVLADPSYQTKPPEHDTPVPDEPLPPVHDFDMPVNWHASPQTGNGGSPSGVSEALLWVLGIGAAAAVLVMIGSALARWQRTRKSRPDVTTQRPTELADLALEALPASLREARALAAQGRFEEAIHLLLRGALDYLRGLSGFALEPALTSREVLRHAPIAGDTRVAVGDLVGSVELSLFGGLPVSADDFERCASSFEVVHRRLGGKP